MCSRRLLNLAREADINVQNARTRSRCTRRLLEIKETCFSWCVHWEFTSLERVKRHLETSSEMFFVLTGIVPDENLSVFKHGKWMVTNLTKVHNAKRAITSCSFVLKTTEKQLYHLLVMERSFLPNRRVVTTRLKNSLPCYKSIKMPIIITKKCKTKRFLVSSLLIVIVAAGCCICQFHTEKRADTVPVLRREFPVKKDTSEIVWRMMIIVHWTKVFFTFLLVLMV